MTKSFNALLHTLALFAWFALFAVAWAFVWLNTLLALSVGLLTGGRWTLEPMAGQWGELLHTPKRLLTEPKP